MNQSILFPDLQQWLAVSECIEFPAQQSGHTISCIISVNKLAKLSGKSIAGEQQALLLFAEYRFDIEELAEELIEEESFNSSGQIEIS